MFATHDLERRETIGEYTAQRRQDQSHCGDSHYPLRVGRSTAQRGDSDEDDGDDDSQSSPQHKHLAEVVAGLSTVLGDVPHGEGPQSQVREWREHRGECVCQIEAAELTGAQLAGDVGGCRQ
jgi:hypothetical protein